MRCLPGGGSRHPKGYRIASVHASGSGIDGPEGMLQVSRGKAHLARRSPQLGKMGYQQLPPTWTSAVDQRRHLGDPRRVLAPELRRGIGAGVRGGRGAGDWPEHELGGPGVWRLLHERRPFRARQKPPLLHCGAEVGGVGGSRPCSTGVLRLRERAERQRAWDNRRPR